MVLPRLARGSPVERSPGQSPPRPASRFTREQLQVSQIRVTRSGKAVDKASPSETLQHTRASFIIPSVHIQFCLSIYLSTYLTGKHVCTYVCMYTYIHRYIHTYMHACMHTYILSLSLSISRSLSLTLSRSSHADGNLLLAESLSVSQRRCQGQRGRI